MSSRIRLARNLADFPFISRATDTDRAEIGKILRGRIETLHEQGKFTGQFTNAFSKREATMLKKGFVEGREFAPAGAKLQGAPGARGLSGATSVHPVTYRKDGW